MRHREILPRWQRVVLPTLVLLAFGLLIYVAAISRNGFASSANQRRESERRDCITTISTARRSVFDNVDIYKAIQIDELSVALLNAQQGIKPTPDQVQAFADNKALLDRALIEARRLQPGVVLDRIIAHGGRIAGKHYQACPAGP